MHIHLFSLDGWLDRQKANKEIVMKGLKNAGHTEKGTTFHIFCTGKHRTTYSSPVGSGGEKENIS